MPRIVDALYPSWTWRIYNSDKVFLTFDDGPHENITPWLLDFSNQKNIKLNFFWLGCKVASNESLSQRVRSSNHFIGNHGFEHINGKKLDKFSFVKNVNKAAKLTSKRFFRPPYGVIKASFYRELPKEVKIIMWSWLSYDWDSNVSDEKILRSLKRNVRKGSILVFHENDKTDGRIQRLFPRVIELLQEKGFTFGLLSEEFKEN